MQMLAEDWAPKPTFTAENVPDLAGKVMLITGGNTGIGELKYLALVCRYLTNISGLQGRKSPRCSCSTMLKYILLVVLPRRPKLQQKISKTSPGKATTVSKLSY